MEPQTPPRIDQDQQKQLVINRFVSTLSGAFRAFFIYKHDNKAIDEIMNNLTKRFKNAIVQESTINLGITNRSLTFAGKPTGFQEVTVYLASSLRNLGFKEIHFRSNCKNANFFAFLNIISGKESNDKKTERLGPLIGEEEDKAISLIPLASNSLALKLSDDVMSSKLAPLKVPRNQGGPGFLEELHLANISTLPDFFIWVRQHEDLIPPQLQNFVEGLVDSTREGYFPFDRFVRNFPMTTGLKTHFEKGFTGIPLSSQRKATPLCRRFIPVEKNQPNKERDLMTELTTYSQKEIEQRLELSHYAAQESALHNLSLAHSLLLEKGPNFAMGLRILIRILGSQNSLAVQEKALKLAIAIWNQSSKLMDDSSMLSLLSSLREQLSSPQNMNLIFFPLRKLTMESEMFSRVSKFIFSLGESAFPPLIKSLETEEDRAMRKKLIHLITLIAKEQGAEFLIESANQASFFLLRNLVMILGDVKSEESVGPITTCLDHPKKMVRLEAVRSLCKIGNETASNNLSRILTTNVDNETKHIIVTYFSQKKDRRVLDTLIRLSKDEKLDLFLRKTLFEAIASIGGPRAVLHFQSLKKGASIFGRFNSEQRELQELIAKLSEKLK